MSCNAIQDRLLLSPLPANAVAIAAVEASYRTRAKAIVVLTNTGNTAKLASKYRPTCPVVAVTRNAQIGRQLHLNQADTLAAVREAVDALPEQERHLIQRHYFEDVRLDEASRELGLSKSWGSRIHSRAIASITQTLKLPRPPR